MGEQHTSQLRRKAWRKRGLLALALAMLGGGALGLGLTPVVWNTPLPYSELFLLLGVLLTGLGSLIKLGVIRWPGEKTDNDT